MGGRHSRRRTRRARVHSSTSATTNTERRGITPIVASPLWAPDAPGAYGDAVTESGVGARSDAVDLAALEAAGLYDPTAPSASDRLAVLEHLLARGAQLPDLVVALEEGGLSSYSGDLVRGRGRPRLTPEDVAATAGVPVEAVLAVSRAAGLPRYDADEPVYRDDDIETFQIFAAGVELFGETATLDFTRAIGAALAGSPMPQSRRSGTTWRAVLAKPRSSNRRLRSRPRPRCSSRRCRRCWTCCSSTTWKPPSVATRRGRHDAEPTSHAAQRRLPRPRGLDRCGRRADPRRSRRGNRRVRASSDRHRRRARWTRRQDDRRRGDVRGARCTRCVPRLVGPARPGDWQRGLA